MCCSCTGGKICEHCRAESCRCWQNPPATLQAGKDYLCFTGGVSKCLSRPFRIWDTLLIPSNPSHLLSRLNNFICFVLYMGNCNCSCCHFFEAFPVLVYAYSDEEPARGAQFFSMGQMTFIQWCNGDTCFVCYLSNP